MAEIVAGGTPSTKISSYWEPKEVPWLSSGEVHKKYITFTDNMISQEGMDNSSAKMIKENSVLIALAGQGKTRGTVAINRIPLTTNQSIAAIMFNDDIVPEFIFCNLENRYDEIRKMSSGDGARGGLNKQLVGDIEIPYTSFEEQKKIGIYFEQLDNLITLHQRQYILLVINRQTWEQRKLGDQMYIKSRIGWQALTKKEYLETGDYYLITGTDIDEDNHIVDLKRCYYVSKERYDMDDKIQVHEGDIIVTKDGTIGKVAMVTGLDKPATLNSHLFVLRDMSGTLDNRFLLQVLSSHIFGDYVDSTKTGSTLTGLPQKTFVEFRFSAPKLDEQKKISQYLDSLDSLITLHRRTTILKERSTYK